MRGIIGVMAGDDEKVVKVEAGALLAPVTPERLIEAFRSLQQRVPSFIQLSVDEQRSMGNVGHLDPEFLDAGIHAAGAWPATKDVTGMTAEEMRARMDASVEWADVRREVEALLKGIDGAILSEKHRVGMAILQIYSIIGNLIDDPRYHHLRPYYENMKKAYRRSRKPRKTKTPKPEE